MAECQIRRKVRRGRTFVPLCMLIPTLLWFSGTATAQTHFRFTSNTGENAVVGIPAASNPNINGSPLAVGDEIGAFSPNGLCVGAAVWNGTGTSITVWGDNSQTPDTVDGIRAGEQISYRVWQMSADIEYEAVTVTYSLGDGRYTANGLYVLSSLNATAPPDPPALESPADGALNVPLSTVFEWSASAFAETYHLQISTDQGFLTQAIDQTNLPDTSYVASGLEANTVYYWRVRSANAAGPGGFSSVRTFTTTLAAPEVPLLSDPPDGAVDLPVNPGLSWNASNGADSYQLQVSADSTFGSTTVNDSALTALTRQVGPLSSGTRYYWRVRAANSGGTSDWSAPWRFTTLPNPPPPPLLASPSDGSSNLSATLTLGWNASEGAVTYDLQVSSDSLFASTAVNDSGISAIFQEVGPLGNGVSYFWRVRARNTGGISPWSERWTFATSANPPSIPTLAAPADGSIDQPTTLNLSWNASDGAESYQLQVAADSTFTSVVVNDSALTTLSRQVGPLSNGTQYTWRVRAMNSGGTSDWSDPSNFTTIPLPPSSPALSSPADGSTGLETSVTLRWFSALRASAYHVQLSTNAAFSSIAFEDSLADTVRSVSALLDNVTYYWRTRAGNSAGWSAFSAPWDFTTKPLNAPSAMTNPATDITATTATIRGLVDPNGLETTVKFGYGTTPNLGNSVDAVENPVTGTEPVPVSNPLRALKPNTTYYFSVGAFSSAGTVTGDTLTFTTNYALAAPLLASPNDAAIDQPIPASLVWHRSTAATTYWLQVSPDSQFVSVAFEDTSVADTTRQVGALARNTTYFWRVQARNSVGPSPWSDIRRFRTIPPVPEAPLLYSPSDRVSEQPLTLSLIWRRSLGANAYQVQVAQSASFSNIFVDSSGVIDSTMTIRNLSNNTTYFWRVRASNAGGISPWSSEWRFTTFEPVPPSPSLISPPDGATGIPNPVTLAWTTASYADTYRLQISTDGLFSAIVVDDSTITSTSSQRALEPATTFFWRVRAQNGAGVSGWSSSRRFLTAGSSTTHPVVLTEGWNMISSFVQPGNPNLDSLCAGVRLNMVLMKNGAGQTYVPEYDINTIGDWTTRDGYKVYMNVADTLMVQGAEVIPEVFPVSMIQGWNMVGYLRSGSLNVEPALQTIAPSLILVKDNDGNVYVPEYGINQIGDMKPGVGYKMYLSQADTLTYPANGSGASSQAVPPAHKGRSFKDSTSGPGSDSTEHFTFTSNTGNNASVIIPASCNPNVGGAPLSEGDEIAAFTQTGMCVGAIVWTGANTALTVWGDDDQTSELDGIRNGERIVYKVWQSATNREIDSVSVDYVQGDGVYSPDAIFILSDFSGGQPTGTGPELTVPRDFMLSQNWPNPFNPQTYIPYGVPQLSHVRLEVFNIIGQTVALLVDDIRTPGHHRALFTSDGLPGGVYLYRLSANNVVLVKKMILLR